MKRNEAMKKYIPLDAVVEEIEKRKSEIKSQIAELGNFDSDKIGLFNDMSLYNDILSFLDTLEVKEVNVNKEIENFEEKIIKGSKAYRAYREECGIKDPILLDEVEEAYYAAYEQYYKDNVKSHREYYQKIDCGKWQITTK